MCVPQAAMVPLMIASTVASAGVTMLGQQYEAEAQANMARYQAKLDERNATLETRRRADAVERGQKDVEAHARKVALLRGRQLASMSAQGLDVSFGSPADIITDTSVLGMEDAATLAENAKREAEGYEISAANFRASAIGNRAAAKNAKTQGRISMFNTALGAATRVAGIQAQYGK